MVFGGAFLSIRTLNRDELEENFRVKVGPDEFPVIFEDGDYENLDRARLNWTVNNLFKSGQDFEMVPINVYNSRKYYIEGREVEAKFYLLHFGSGYRPEIKIRYTDIVKVDGINHIVLSREFIETFIEASLKYGKVTDELNNFIDRLNRKNSAEIDNLTEAEVDSMYYIDPNINEDDFDLEDRREGLREFTVDSHFQSTNVFWIEELPEEEIDFLEDEAESMLLGQAIYYKRKDNLPWWFPDDKVNLELTPPSNFNPRLHTDPDAESFIWVPANKWLFLYDKGQWKIAIFRGPP